MKYMFSVIATAYVILGVFFGAISLLADMTASLVVVATIVGPMVAGVVYWLFSNTNYDNYNGVRSYMNWLVVFWVLSPFIWTGMSWVCDWAGNPDAANTYRDTRFYILLGVPVLNMAVNFAVALAATLSDWLRVKRLNKVAVR